jgi:hypothetical protein
VEVYPEKEFQGAAKPLIGQKLNKPALIFLPKCDLQRGNNNLALEKLRALAGEQGVSQ